MTAKVQQQSNKKSKLLNITAILLVLIGFCGNYCLEAQSLLLRGVIIITAMILAAVCFSKSIQGKVFLTYWNEALLEVRKIVWPTKKETIQSTTGVLVMVLIMGIFLWLVDSVLMRMIAWFLAT